MRKVTRDVCNAFINRNRRSVGNTCTDGEELLLHGNRIAWREGDRIMTTLAGWPTVTTRERLNGLCELLGLGRPYHQNHHIQYFQDNPINSTDIIPLVQPVQPAGWSSVTA